MATALAGLAIVGGVMKAGSQLTAAQSQASNERVNAIFARGEADVEAIKGEREAKKISRRKKIFAGRQIAQTAKSGVLMSGSPLELLEENMAEFEKDEILTRINSRARARKLDFQATTGEARARNIQRAAPRQAAATLLSTAGTAGNILSTA